MQCGRQAGTKTIRKSETSFAQNTTQTSAKAMGNISILFYFIFFCHRWASCVFYVTGAILVPTEISGKLPSLGWTHAKSLLGERMKGFSAARHFSELHPGVRDGFSWSCIQGSQNPPRGHLSASFTSATCWTTSARTFPANKPAELQNMPDEEISRHERVPEDWFPGVTTAEGTRPVAAELSDSHRSRGEYQE